LKKTYYFDYSATTPVKEEVILEMMPYFKEKFGNPSSNYKIGREARKGIEHARSQVSKAINSEKSEIYFTSCGSESNNLALKGIAKANIGKGKHIITSSFEHPSVLNTCKSLEKEGFEITYIKPDKEGIIATEKIKNAIKSNTVLISIMLVNNEIGTIQPIKEIGKIAKEHNIIFHTDAVQAVGHVRIDVKEMNIDSLSLSAHKFFGPKGVGALYVRDWVKFDKIQDGGHQENDKRAGTENVASIVGLGKAIEIATDNIEKHNELIRRNRDFFINEIEIKFKNIKVNGNRIKKVPGNANILFLGKNSQKILAKLDEAGICASAGSACSSGSSEPSHVLKAIGLTDEEANSSIRFCFGEDTSIEDIKYLIKMLDLKNY